eukprot:TRINITY_DN10764_c0_g1_i1.p1 TRINITY_DN10764_c0_g1~~TRINITY_DN10764_c0_g1_i1.p1  ORF type:complete len:596 (-),score=112.01 TRINITY_DN10764_c0_g1_i1:104-1891(-)
MQSVDAMVDDPGSDIEIQPSVPDEIVVPASVVARMCARSVDAACMGQGSDIELEPAAPVSAHVDVQPSVEIVRPADTMLAPGAVASAHVADDFTADAASQNSKRGNQEPALPESWPSCSHATADVAILVPALPAENATQSSSAASVRDEPSAVVEPAQDAQDAKKASAELVDAAIASAESVTSACANVAMDSSGDCLGTEAQTVRPRKWRRIAKRENSGASPSRSSPTEGDDRTLRLLSRIEQLESGHGIVASHPTDLSRIEERVRELEERDADKIRKLEARLDKLEHRERPTSRRKQRAHSNKVKRGRGRKKSSSISSSSVSSSSSSSRDRSSSSNGADGGSADDKDKEQSDSSNKKAELDSKAPADVARSSHLVCGTGVNVGSHTSETIASLPASENTSFNDKAGGIPTDATIEVGACPNNTHSGNGKSVASKTRRRFSSGVCARNPRGVSKASRASGMRPKIATKSGASISTAVKDNKRVWRKGLLGLARNVGANKENARHDGAKRTPVAASHSQDHRRRGSDGRFVRKQRIALPAKPPRPRIRKKSGDGVAAGRGAAAKSSSTRDAADADIDKPPPTRLGRRAFRKGPAVP